MSRFSASRAFAPPQPSSRATAVRRWRRSSGSSLIGLRVRRHIGRGKIASLLISLEHRNSPGARLSPPLSQGEKYISITVLHQYETFTVAMSVRLEPALEARIEQEARRLGVSKSEFVKDALERVLGLKDPAELLEQVRSGTPVGAANISERVSQKVRTKLREKHPD
jgi:predicted DNA-binding protein